MQSPQLVLDLIGPFVVCIQPTLTGPGIANIYSPLCLDHHANILTDSDDVSLCGLSEAVSSGDKGFIYTFENADTLSPKGASTPRHDTTNKFLNLPFHLPSEIPQQACHLVFRVPCPDTIVGLIPEAIWIHRNGSHTWFDPKLDSTNDIVQGKYARGLRFIYTTCKTSPIITMIEQPKPAANEYRPPLNELNPQGLDLPFYKITLRLVSNNPAPDDHHEDAYNCFCTMRDLIDVTGGSTDTKQWRVDFNDLSQDEVTVYMKSGQHPTDCHAATIVIEDTEQTVQKKGVPAISKKPRKT